MPEALSLEQIKNACSCSCDIHLLQSVDSTSEWLMQQLGSGAKLPLACFAEAQTGGRGRRGRKWVSPPAANIYMSLAWRLEVPVRDIGFLSLAMGVAVVRVLENAGIGGVQLKWPNDVQVDGRKLAGILIETAGISDTDVIVVIGVGLNYDLPDTLAEVPDQPWTDVLSLLPATSSVSRGELAGNLLQQCLQICEGYPKNREALLRAFREKYDACYQCAVRVTLGNGARLEGTACGVTEAGEIRVQIEGEERLFNSAEISLAKHIT